MVPAVEGGWDVKVAGIGWGRMSEEGGVVVGQLVGLVHGIHADLPQQKLSHPVGLGESLGFHTLQLVVDDHQHSALTYGDMMVVFRRHDSH